MFRNPTADLLVVLLIVLLIFGPKRLPGLGRQLGQGIREFKDSITGNSGDDETERPAISSTSTTTPGTTPPTSAHGAAPTAGPTAAPGGERESAEVGSEPRR